MPPLRGTDFTEMMAQGRGEVLGWARVPGDPRLRSTRRNYLGGGPAAAYHGFLPHAAGCHINARKDRTALVTTIPKAQGERRHLDRRFPKPTPTAIDGRQRWSVAAAA
jgi:hypothetical protein